MNYALITGASRGIGLQYARVMARRGYNLVVVSNEQEIFDKASELKNEYSVDVIPVLQDLSKENAAKELFLFCEEKKIVVEVLINNAGVYHDKDFIDDSESFNILILNLHMITPAMLCYYFGKKMAENHKGYILNMCSITSTMAIQRLGTYGATKAFLNNFSRSLYIELKDKGVTVTNISPGAVDTGLYNVNKTVSNVGKFFGFIISPQALAEKAVKKLFKGRRKVFIPFFWGILTAYFVAIIPTFVLRIIRRLGWF